MNVRVESISGPVRSRTRRRGPAALPDPVPRTRRDGVAGRASRAGRRQQAGACTSCERPSQSLRSVFPALVLAGLLAGWAGVVEAAFDPMVEAVQRALTERGFDPGKIDGAMGSRTRAALTAFQGSVGLPVTGKIDAATVAALGLEPPEAESKPPPATSRADPEPDVDSSTVPEPDADSGTVPEPDADSGTEPEPDADSGAVPEPDADSGAKPEPDAVSGTVPEPGADSGGVPEPDADSGTEPEPDADSGTVPEPDAASTEPPRAAPAPQPTPKPVLRFATLGWHPPMTGAQALERFLRTGAPRDFKRGSGSLFVPKAGLVFVLQAGERIPGLDCDPGAGSLVVEFVFGPDGPVIFTPAAGEQFCQMGIGIALEVGRTLDLRAADWGDAQFPQGTVRVTANGLRYID